MILPEVVPSPCGHVTTLLIIACKTAKAAGLETVWFGVIVLRSGKGLNHPLYTEKRGSNITRVTCHPVLHRDIDDLTTLLRPEMRDCASILNSSDEKSLNNSSAHI